MIYIFSCCKEGCSLPARLCGACTRCLREGPCADCCAALADCSNDFFNRPLGGFVFMAFWVGVLELGLSLYSVVDWDKLQYCQFVDSTGNQVGMYNWLMVQAGFAALNVLFAPYMQWKLWRRLNEEAREPDDSDGEASPRTRIANTPYGQVAASKHDIKEAFKEVFLYDCGVLLYFLALIGSFAWSYLGQSWIGGSDSTLCNPEPGLPHYAALVGLCFPIFVAFYGCAWYCTMSWMDDSTTLILRHGVTAAAAVAAAAGRPIPGQGVSRGGYPGRGGGRPNGFAKLQAMTALMQADSTARGGGSMQSGHDAGKQKYTAVGADNCYDDNANISNNKKPSSVKSFAKLLACLGLDFMGNASYFLPAAGEVTDVVFAPASAVMLKMMFNANGVAMLGLAEELAPYTDVVPTATIAWFLETCLPNHPVTKFMGIQSEWAMTGSNSGRY